MSNDLLKEVQSVMKQRRMNIVALSKHSNADKQHLDKQLAEKFQARIKTGIVDHKSGKA